MSEVCVVFNGPSPWRIGRCAECRQPIHFLAAEVVVHIDGSGRSFHRKCWAATDTEGER